MQRHKRPFFTDKVELLASLMRRAINAALIYLCRDIEVCPLSQKVSNETFRERVWGLSGSGLNVSISGGNVPHHPQWRVPHKTARFH